MSFCATEVFFAAPPSHGGAIGQRLVPLNDVSEGALQKEVWRTRASHILERAMTDRTRSTCPYTLLGCLASLGPTLTTSSDRTDNLWTKFLRFITLPRTSFEVLSLMDVHCPCDEETRIGRLHQAGEARFEPVKAVYRAPSGWAVHELFRVLESATALARQPRFRLWKAPKQMLEAAQGNSERSPWPQELSQLLPHGPEDTFRGTAAWFAGARDRRLLTALFQLLVVYLAQCPMVVPFLVNSSIVVGGIVNFVDSEESSWRSTFVDVERRLTDANYSIGNTVTFLDHFFILPLPARLVFLRRMPGPLLRACDKAMTICDEQRVAARGLLARSRVPQAALNELDRQWMRFFLFALDILLWIPPLPERACLANAHRLEEGLMRERATMTGTPTGQLEETLKGLEFQQRCARLGCKETFQDHRARFRYCAACHRVPYCSDRCAKMAWRDTVLPHRGVCVDLRTLCSRLGIRRQRVEEQFGERRRSGCPFVVEPEGPRIVAHFKNLNSRQYSAL